MTIEEKRKYVSNYCESVASCGDCACREECDEIPRAIADMNENELDTMINKIPMSDSPDKEVEQELAECENRVAFSQSYEDMIGEAVYVKFRINSIGIDKNGVRYNLVSDMEIGGRYMQLNCVKAEVFERGST